VKKKRGGEVTAVATCSQKQQKQGKRPKATKTGRAAQIPHFVDAASNCFQKREQSLCCTRTCRILTLKNL
jgi:hypothetical protein